MVSSSYKSLSEEYTPEERVENSFKLLGKNIDEKLTLEEFQKGINRGYAALRILQLYEYIL
jgi:Ca2+-binding EF-hand superfamily protein